MAGKIFTKIATKAELAGIDKKSRESSDWFINNLKHMRANLPRRTLLTDEKLKQRQKPLIGRMFMFVYDPKTKDTLPYYDKFPLVIMVAPAKGGFYGLNMHYLPPKLRAVFFDELNNRLNNKKLDRTTRFRLTYQMLKASKKMRMFKPCFKRYLFKQIKSKTVEVPPAEWRIAMFLPTDNFAKEQRQKIWKKSRDLFRRS